MTRALLANNASTTLSVAISSAGTTALNVTSAVGFPVPTGGAYFYCTLLDSANIPEIVLVTAVVSNVFTVLRGQEGTTARASIASGAKVSLNLTAATINELAPKTGEGTSGNWPINAATATLAALATNATTAAACSGNAATATLAANATNAATAASCSGSAATAALATSLIGGGAGQIPYQSAPGTTALLAVGTPGQVLQTNGGTAPSWANVLKSYTSSGQTITSAGFIGLAHGLGVIPNQVSCRLVCQSAEAGYSVNDSVFYHFSESSSTSRGISVTADATNLSIRYGSAANVFMVLNKANGVETALTNGNWVAVFGAVG